MKYLTLLLLATQLLAQEIIFSHETKSQKFTLATLQKEFKENEIEIMEPHESKLRSYVGFLTKEIFEKEFKNWKQATFFEFVCADGYKLKVPIKEFMKRNSYLVFKAKEGDFSLINTLQNNEKVSLGPFYLIWETKKKEKANYWPYQVGEIKLLREKNPYAKLYKGKKTKRGYELYTSKCIKCHQLNDLGKKKAPDMNTILTYKKKADFIKYVLNPRKVNKDSTMPILFKDKDHIEKIYEYLIHH